MDSTNDTESTSLQDYFSIVIVGDENVGKTCILNKYCNNQFSFSKKKQKSLEIYKKTITINGEEIRLKLWDTQYNESYFKLNKQIYERADCIIYACSLNNKDSFVNIDSWYQILSDNIDLSNKQMMILVNKCDLEEERAVSKEEMKQKADSLDMTYYEVSALNGNGLEDAFKAILTKVVSTYSKTGDTQELKQDENTNSSNCIS